MYKMTNEWMNDGYDLCRMCIKGGVKKREISLRNIQTPNFKSSWIILNRPVDQILSKEVFICVHQ